MRSEKRSTGPRSKPAWEAWFEKPKRGKRKRLTAVRHVKPRPGTYIRRLKGS